MAKLVGPNRNIADLRSEELGWWRGVLYWKCFSHVHQKRPKVVQQSKARTSLTWHGVRRMFFSLYCLVFA